MENRWLHSEGNISNVYLIIDSVNCTIIYNRFFLICNTHPLMVMVENYRCSRNDMTSACNLVKAIVMDIKNVNFRVKAKNMTSACNVVKLRV